jgi:ABC-type branched-subunit amino acid transport system ATPase component/ABC-type branched-subunit amino acid transport system permease subunit
MIDQPSTRSFVKHLIVPAALLIVGWAASFNQYVLYLATLASISYILTAGFNISFGYAGMFNLAYITIFGLSAFFSVFLEVQYGLTFWTSLVLTISFATVVSVIVTAPTARLEGIFLAILTLAFSLAVAEVTLKWQSFTGGAVGIYIIPRPTLFGEPILNGSLSYYLLCAVGVVLAFEVSLRTDRSALGRRYRALQSNPRTLLSVGASIPRVRLIACVTSGALAGIAGALFAHFQPAISLETFGLDRLIALLLAISLGGPGSLLGPFLGVIALVVMDELTLATGHAHSLIYGVGIIALCILGEGGIAGAIDRIGSFVKRPADGRPSSGLAVAAASNQPEPVAMWRDKSHDYDAPSHEFSTHNVTVRFGGLKAVDNVSTAVRPGEILGLIGPNGAGKTTLLNAMTGNIRVIEGKVALGDTELDGKSFPEIVRLGVARTFQSPQLVPDISIIDNVKLGFELDRRTTMADDILDTARAQGNDAEAERRAMSLLERFGIAHRAHALASSQPYAVLRLVEIARNLMLSPRFLLLDEPGAGLSVEEQAELSRLLRSLASSGLGILIVDHSLGLIRSTCDRLMVLDYGTTIAEGNPDEVFASKDVVAAYLGGTA